MKIDPKCDVLHESHGALLKIRNNISIPISYPNAKHTLQLLWNSYGILDLKACFLIALQGIDALVFLQGMLSCDLRPLSIGKVQGGFLCASKGKILHQVEVFRKGEEEYVICCAPEDGMQVGNHLDHFHISEDFEIHLLNPSLLRCDVMGAKAENALKNMGLTESGSWTWQNSSIVSVNSALRKTPRWINFIEGGIYADFLEALLSEDSHPSLMGLYAYRSLHSHEGIPRFGVDYGTNNFPQESALRDFISYGKGCYLGQEPHARMFRRGQPKWQCVKISLLESLNAQAEAPLYHEGELAGHITSVSTDLGADPNSDSQNKRIHGIAMVRYSLIKKKFMLSLNAEQQQSVSCEQLWF